MTGAVDVVIEIPRGSRNKLEYDAERGVMRFDRRLPGGFAFPADYGYVPGTAGSDGEPLDALVLLVEPTYPGVWVSTRLIGVFWIMTGHGREAKLLCVPAGEPAYDGIADVEQLPEHVLTEIGNFFDVYRRLDAHSHTSYEGHEGARGRRRRPRRRPAARGRSLVAGRRSGLASRRG